MRLQRIVASFADDDGAAFAMSASRPPCDGLAAGEFHVQVMRRRLAANQAAAPPAKYA